MTISKPVELPADASDEAVGRAFFEWWNTHLQAAPHFLTRVARGTAPKMATALQGYGEAQRPGNAPRPEPRHLAKTGAELSSGSPAESAREFNSENLGNAQLAQALRWAGKGEFGRAGRILKQYGDAQRAQREQQQRVEKDYSAKAAGGRNAARKRTERRRAQRVDALGLLETYEQSTGQRLSPKSPSDVRKLAAEKIGCHPDTLLRVLNKRADSTAR